LATKNSTFDGLRLRPDLHRTPATNLQSHFTALGSLIPLCIKPEYFSPLTNRFIYGLERAAIAFPAGAEIISFVTDCRSALFSKAGHLAGSKQADARSLPFFFFQRWD